jgi:molybdopterin-containing oxidoreductase family membrane subunit
VLKTTGESYKNEMGALELEPVEEFAHEYAH